MIGQKSQKIIVAVDDDDACLYGVRLLFELDGDVVVTYCNGYDFWKSFESMPISPDIFILDYHTGDGAGALPSLVKMRKLFSDTPIIILTGDTSKEVQKAVMKLGCHYMAKPVKAERLKAAVEALLS